MATTSYMTLSLPTVSVTAGPAWATAINAALSVVDAHDHSPGKGVPVRTSGLYVDAGLSFGGYDVSSLRSARFTNHAAPLALPTDLGCLFVSGGELYYRDAVGNAIQFTSGGALNTASLGAIGGDYSTSGASLFYTSASKLFSFESSAGVKAHAALGNLSITEAVASGKAVTLKAPTGLAANYQLTLPSALPAATKILTVDNTGAVAAVYDVDGTTLEVAANALRVKDGGITGAKLTTSVADATTLEYASGSLRVKDLGITTAKLAAQAVTQAKIANLAVGTAQMADSAVTTAQIADGSVTNAKMAASSTVPTILVKITGYPSGGGTALRGSLVGAGYTFSRLGIGSYRIAHASFSATASAVFVTARQATHLCTAVISAGSVQIDVYEFDGATRADDDVSVMIYL